MPVLEIVTIGTELLLGEINDTNSTYIARTMRDHGIDIYRVTTIGDNPKRIAAAIQEASTRADIVITTGGLGPTIDDPTREAVAEATHRKLVFIDALWDQIVERFKGHGRTPTENNRRQAYIPEGAIPIRNPVGTAPCFIVEQELNIVISLPGVPQEMKYLLHKTIIPYLKQKFNLQSQTIKATVLHTASLGESVIDELIEDLEVLDNPSVGLLAHPGQVDVRITAKAPSEIEADKLIKPVFEELIIRLGDHIYGFDGAKMEDIICKELQSRKLSLTILEYGLDQNIGKVFQTCDGQKIKFHSFHENVEDLESLSNSLTKLRLKDGSDLAFGLAIFRKNNAILNLAYQKGNNTITQSRYYGGASENDFRWAKNVSFDFLRRNILELPDN